MYTRVAIDAPLPCTCITTLHQVLDNPNGWRFKTVANSTMVIATPEDIKVRNAATANSKLAPAIALAGTNILSKGAIEAYTDVAATGRPGLQYGATVAKADQYLQSLTTDSFNTGTVLHGQLLSGREMLYHKSSERTAL